MKKTICLLTLTTFLCSLAYAQQKSSAQITAAIDKLLIRQFPANETGATVIVSKKGKIIYKKALGLTNLELNIPMQYNNIFRIGSVTKQFTAVAILQLMEKEKLNLEDKINTFMPGYPMGNSITIEHLLTHTSGIPDFTTIKDNETRSRTDYTPEEMINYFKDRPLRFAPGTRWEYSNSNYFLLGYIIEKITGNTYADYLEENFFKPLGMRHSSYASDSRIIPNRATGYTRAGNAFENAAYASMSQPYAAGSILSTVEDLFTWNQAIQSHRLLKKATLDKAFTRYKLIDGNETNYGYGWRLGYIQQSPSTWHGGLINGFMSMAMYLPDEDVFVAVLSNCDCKSPQDITAKLAAIAIGKPYDYKIIPVPNNILNEYIGVYENKNGQQLMVSLPGAQLNVQFGHAPKTIVQAFKKDQFFFTNDTMLSMEFVRNKNNGVDQLMIHSRIANEVWKKSNKAAAALSTINVDEKILETYTGEYEVNPNFSFAITREQDRLFLKATGQEKLQLFAEAENKFYLKENGAQLEFARDSSGKVIKAILTQGGRQTDAGKVK